MRVEDAKTKETWLGNFTHLLISEISQKSGKSISAQELLQHLISSFKNHSGVDMMSAFELESLKIKRGGQPSAQNKKSNKKYLILSVGSNDQKVHYPLPLQFKDVVPVETLKDMIKALKDELEQTREEEKSSISNVSDILNTSSVGENLKTQNEKMKQTIRDIEEELAQKKGAVELDQMMKEKNELELRVETLKR